MKLSSYPTHRLCCTKSLTPNRAYQIPKVPRGQILPRYRYRRCRSFRGHFVVASALEHWKLQVPLGWSLWSGKKLARLAPKSVCLDWLKRGRLAARWRRGWNGRASFFGALRFSRKTFRKNLKINQKYYSRKIFVWFLNEWISFFSQVIRSIRALAHSVELPKGPSLV